MSKKWRKLFWGTALVGIAAAGYAYYLKTKNYKEDLNEDFSDTAEDPLAFNEDDTAEAPAREYVSINLEPKPESDTGSTNSAQEPAASTQTNS